MSGTATLGDVVTLEYGKPLPPADRAEDGPIPVYGANGVKAASVRALVDNPGIIVGRKGSAGAVNLTNGPFWPLDVTYFVNHDPDETDLMFLFYLLNSLDLPSLAKGVKPGLNRNDAYALPVYVPPLDEQRRIVATLDEALGAISGLRDLSLSRGADQEALRQAALGQLVSRARVTSDEVTLGSFLEIARGGSPRPIKSYLTDDIQGVNWIKIGDATAATKYIYKTEQRIRKEGVARSRMVYEGDFLLSNSMSFGRPYIMGTSGCIHDGWLVLRPRSSEFNPDYLYFALSSDYVFRQFDSKAAGSTVRNLNIDLVRSVKIPLPDLATQGVLAAKMAAIDDSCSDLESISASRLEAISAAEKTTLSSVLPNR